MSDTSLSKYMHYGTNAERLAFTPAPPTGPQPLYFWYETDTDFIYVFTTAWQGPLDAGGGTGATVTGTPANGQLTKFSGAASVTNGNLSGDVTTAGTLATTIANDAVSNAKLANMATQTFKGRTTAGTGDPEDLTVTQATALLNAMVGDSGAGGTKGLVPAPSAGDAAAAKFLKADGVWTVPAGAGTVATTGSPASGDLVKFSGATTITTGALTGDVTTSGLAATIANDAVTYAKMQNASAASRVLGRRSGSAGDLEELTPNLNLAVSSTNLNVSIPLTDDGNSGTALTLDFASSPRSSHKLTLTGNVTLTLSNPLDGGCYLILIKTGAGSFTVTWPGTVLWSGGSTPTITATGSKVDVVTLVYDSTATKYYASINQNF